MHCSWEDHSLSFQYTGQNDDESFDMAFNKKRADDRKDSLIFFAATQCEQSLSDPFCSVTFQEWINEADDEEFVDHSKDCKFRWPDLTSSHFISLHLSLLICLARRVDGHVLSMENSSRILSRTRTLSTRSWCNLPSMMQPWRIR